MGLPRYFRPAHVLAVNRDEPTVAHLLDDRRRVRGHHKLKLREDPIEVVEHELLPFGMQMKVDLVNQHDALGLREHVALQLRVEHGWDTRG